MAARGHSFCHVAAESAGNGLVVRRLANVAGYEDVGNMPCLGICLVVHSELKVLGQIKPKQKLHFWPAHVNVRSSCLQEVPFGECYY